MDIIHRTLHDEVDSHPCFRIKSYWLSCECSKSAHGVCNISSDILYVASVEQISYTVKTCFERLPQMSPRIGSSRWSPTRGNQTLTNRKKWLSIYTHTPRIDSSLKIGAFQNRFDCNVLRISQQLPAVHA